MASTRVRGRGGGGLLPVEVVAELDTSPSCPYPRATPWPHGGKREDAGGRGRGVLVDPLGDDVARPRQCVLGRRDTTLRPRKRQRRPTVRPGGGGRAGRATGGEVGSDGGRGGRRAGRRPCGGTVCGDKGCPCCHPVRTASAPAAPASFMRDSGAGTPLGPGQVDVLHLRERRQPAACRGGPQRAALLGQERSTAWRRLSSSASCSSRSRTVDTDTSSSDPVASSR